jgi:hypothetical protein
METTTYAVYSMTPKGSFSQKYEGSSEEAALKAYNKLLDGNLPRSLTRCEPHPTCKAGITTTVMSGGGFPQD